MFTTEMMAAALAGTALLPVAGFGQQTPLPPAQEQPAPDTEVPGGAIVSDSAFEAALPSLDPELGAPLEPIEQTGSPADPLPPLPALQDGDGAETIADAPIADPALAEPLPALATFDVNPAGEVAATEDGADVEIAYDVVVQGLDEVGLESRFRALSALEEGDGEAANATMVSARGREDEALAMRLLRAEGYLDATAISSVEAIPDRPGRIRAIVTAAPGARYTLGSVAVDAPAVVPPDLITAALPLKPGDPILADRVQGAEANVSLELPRRGYPFAELGTRDILLDEVAHTGAYTLPVTPGPRSSFGTYSTEGELAFDARHVGVLARFEQGELYDSRKVDDLRDALVATGLFSTVSVEPQRTGTPGPDGTEQVNLLVRQDAGPARTLAAEGGYGTGQGFRLEGSFTHRNLFPPEGALIVAGVAGTQEQGLNVSFRRSNAGQRDRTVSLLVGANRSDYDAFEAFTGQIAGRISYDSTPIWQKRITYGFGFELIGTNESRFDFALGERARGTYFIGAIPLQLGFDTSDSLLNPTRGFRIAGRVSPETSIRGGTRPYGRVLLDGSIYYPLGDSFVIAARARAGTIAGIDRDDLAPSRRYYAGGGGSVRGFGYQQLGPRDPENNPVGGRSLNEFALEARYRFGNFGIVPFVDAGQVYDSTLPRFSNLRFGAGIGGRFYTNFGPFRVDVATPIARKEGESLVAVYVSIGQAF